MKGLDSHAHVQLGRAPPRQDRLRQRLNGAPVGVLNSREGLWPVQPSRRREQGQSLLPIDPTSYPLLERPGESKTKLAKELGVSRNKIYMYLGRGGN